MCKKTQQEPGAGIEIAVLDWSMLGAGHCTWELWYTLQSVPTYEIPTVKEELALLQLYYTALLEARPEIERSYSFDELLADFQLVSIARLIYHIIDYANPRKVAEVEVEEAEEYVQV